MIPAFKAVLAANDYTAADLPQLLNRSPNYVYNRTNGNRPWSMDDIYTIIDWLGLPDTDIPRLFPRQEEY